MRDAFVFETFDGLTDFTHVLPGMRVGSDKIDIGKAFKGEDEIGDVLVSAMFGEIAWE